MNDERRREIEREAIAQVGGEFWGTISRRMTELEGKGWAAGVAEAELVQREDGKLHWRVGDRTFTVTEYVEESQPTRWRLIGPGGVVVIDRPILRPDLN